MTTATPSSRQTWTVQDNNGNNLGTVILNPGSGFTVIDTNGKAVTTTSTMRSAIQALGG